MELGLVVIKTNQIERVVFFYQTIGFTLREEKHGNGPIHFSAQVGHTVFEIYPLPASATTADTTTRLGFRLDHLNSTISELKEKSFQIIKEPMQTEWGTVAIVKDPDGRLIELYQK